MKKIYDSKLITIMMFIPVYGAFLSYYIIDRKLFKENDIYSGKHRKYIIISLLLMALIFILVDKLITYDNSLLPILVWAIINWPIQDLLFMHYYNKISEKHS